jgi:MFS family permease
MGDTEREASDPRDLQVASEKLNETLPTLWRRYGSLPKNVIAISLVSLLNDASSEIIYPLLPVFLASTLGASAKVIGLIEGSAESISSLLKLFAGYYSDRIGKRKILVAGGYALANLVRPLLAFASSWHQVLLVRLSDRVGKGVRSAPRDAMIADTVTEGQRGLAFGFHRAMDHLGAVIGPLIGYLLVFLFVVNRDSPSPAEFKTIFLMASVPGLAAVLVAIFLVREAPKRQHVKASVKQPVLSLTGFDRNFKRFLLIIALFTLSNSSDGFLILRARDAGVSVTTLPLLWAALHTTKVISSLWGGDLSDRLGRRRLIVSGWLLYAAVYAGFAFVSSNISVWILFLIYGIYFGLAEGAEKALVADLVRPDQRGTAYGLYNLAFGITVLPASLLMGTVWDWRGPATAFLVSAGIGVAAAALMLTVRTSSPLQANEISSSR